MVIFLHVTTDLKLVKGHNCDPCELPKTSDAKIFLVPRKCQVLTKDIPNISQLWDKLL